ncbi:conserved hypothetical protein [Tenacibaculum maritimum]|nr:conserved hypothetical protein [Tenacibaculum maritimum]
MIKINTKIQFILMVVCFFFIGLGINNIIENYTKEEKIFRLISPIVPFIIFASIFFRNIYLKKKNKS